VQQPSNSDAAAPTIDARHLTEEADWTEIAQWCAGQVRTESGATVIQTSIGPARAGSWIVATPGGLFSHAVYADRDYRGFLALMANAGHGIVREEASPREHLVGRALDAMTAAGSGLDRAVLAALAAAAVDALIGDLGRQ
jgi:hypothetical protein